MSAPKTAGRPPLTREQVLHTAVTLADRDGLAALNMRGLGEALGVKAMSLYNHVANKDALLDGMVERVISEVELPSLADPWRVAMSRRARSAHSVLLRHPWACPLLMSRANIGPAMIRYVDATLRCLQQAGFSLPMADHAWNAMDSYIYGFTLHKLNFPIEADQYAVMAAAYLPTLSPVTHPALRALSELVATRQHDGLHTLEFGFELLLDGLERLRPGAG